MADMSYEDCYRGRGLEFGAGIAEVNRAWRTLTVKSHPDKFATNPIAYKQAVKTQQELNIARGQLKKWCAIYPG